MCLPLKRYGASAGFRLAYGAALWSLYTSAVGSGGCYKPEKEGGAKEDRKICKERHIWMETENDEEWENRNRKRGGDRDRGDADKGDGKEGYVDREGERACREEGDSKVKSGPFKSFLFCVMGGRFSEGTNFSDALARLLLLVGLPFPNIKDSVFNLHKMHYDKQCNEGMKSAAAAVGAAAVTASAVGNDPAGPVQEAQQQRLLKQQLQKQLQQQQQQQEPPDYGLLRCMVTVNQTIGRAIRHSKDYAAVLLVDERYASPKIQQLLPLWLQKTVETFTPAITQPPQQELPQQQRLQLQEKRLLAQRLEKFFLSAEGIK